ncbi:DUF4421 domain-containing protein [Chitinophaga niabensis]|uniref:DUF4421 domain-containing protein n=1 Tax=Chitinophaga niabensis TaxID=536979 RepID=A0A1N6KH89_9BACT|nr:DUF4421 domain-containing protein [Chitinophaga niabensis]SIO55910.1 protein of unknown function [Chitinophaga niabensis]
MIIRCVVLVLVLFLSASAAFAQQRLKRLLQTENDSAYIEDHTEDLTVRVFGSRKYTYYDIVDKRLKEEVLYRPNTSNNIGFGFNYKFIGINIGFKLPFINNDDDQYGKTKYLDLQSHLYLRKLVIDFYGQYYKGYYLANRRFNSQALSLRPDMYNTDLGLNVQYIFNDKKFSYRAAYLQNEYQKKSAGSFIVGGEVFAWKMKGDSALIPSNLGIEGFFDNEPFHRTSSVSMAANVGYAHTFVIKKYFFVTASLTGSAGVNQTVLNYLDGRNKRREFGWQLNNTVRFSAGYNSSKYFAGIHYVDMVTRSESPVNRTYQTFGTGNFRVSVARRFALKKPLF